MKIALIGHGKMGRLIEQLATAQNDQVVLRLNSANNADGAGITSANLAHADVAIEFSSPQSVISNIHRLAALGVNMVVGTTGWFHEMDRIRKLVQECNVGLVWGPNFSIGANVFQRVVAHAAQILQSRTEYGAWAWELHHAAKKDAPSGTLLHLVEQMRAAGWDRRIDQASSRAGAVPGTHEVGFDSAADTITLRHTARNRDGFAEGAVAAAHWIQGKRGCHEFSEIIFQ